MNKTILKLIIITSLLIPNVMAEPALPPVNNPDMHPQHGQFIMPPKPTSKEIKQMDKLIEQRLNLTDEQIKMLKTNKQKNMKELEKIVSKMETLHKKIRDVYLLGIPKYQADLRTAPYKMELALLKQNADTIRYQNRKFFLSILTNEQKNEFKLLKEELIRNRVNK